MDHRTFIAGLSASERARLTEKSDAKGLVMLVLHFGLIALFGALIALGVPGWQFLMMAQGILIIFLFTLLHETVHGTAFRSPWLNEWVARVCGFLIAVPADWFRYFHFAHHRHTQDPEKDPELATRKPETVWQYIAHVSGLPTWKGEFQTLFNNAIADNRDAFVPKNGRRKVRREAIVTLALYALLAAVSIAFGSGALLYVWILPCLLGQPFLRLYLLAEHGRCPFVANMLENSRTTYTNTLVRKLAWNMPYHAEHHSYPTVPFHKLPDLHRLTKAHLGATSDGYSEFHADYLSDLKGAPGSH
ncbi:fatty acid desaturase family protein [uncultured Roseibium sp.]|uniref:fatty acid desaturase family protein n=1 Tax=uncultured Roseibium sp. TaxID=1936171 RepID=UPI00260BC74B|nr:fatty acid desaturase family protein [uncultured Roseibium sp.]